MSEWHNVFSVPLSAEEVAKGIEKARKQLQELREQWDKEDAEILAGIPMQPHEAPRILDLCPDERNVCPVCEWEPCDCHDQRRR